MTSVETHSCENLGSLIFRGFSAGGLGAGETSCNLWDVGQNSFYSPAVGNKLDAQFNLDQYANALLKSLQKYLESIGVPETRGETSG